MGNKRSHHTLRRHSLGSSSNQRLRAEPKQAIKRLQDEPKECLRRRLRTLVTSFHFRHFRSLCLWLTPRSFLVLVIFRPFPKHLACFGQDGHTEWRSDSDLPNEVCDITNCVTIYYEKDVRAGMPSFGKKVLSLDVKEIEDAQSFEINCEERFTSHLLNMGMKIFFFWYVNKRKENSKTTFLEKLQPVVLTFISYQLNPWSSMRYLFF